MHNPLRQEEEAIGLLTEMEETNKLHSFEKNGPQVSHRRVSAAEHLKQTPRRFTFSIGQIGSLFLLLLPSFVAAHLTRKHNTAPPAKLRPTAYLDGIRGLAAWSVFNAHLSACLIKSAGSSWGSNGGNHEIFKFPIVNLIYKGDFAVALFFVIGGYVLSMGPVTAMAKSPRDSAAMMKRMSSTAFRRSLRLLLPSIASMFVVLVLTRLDYFTYFKANAETYDTVVKGWSPIRLTWPDKTPTLLGQFRDFIECAANLLTIFVNSTDPTFKLKYNAVLWTIKLELRCSLVIFATQLAVFYMARRARIVVISVLALLAWYVWAFEFALFWYGFLLAEVLPLLSAQGVARNISLKSLGFGIVLLVGGYLGSFPAWHPDWSPGYAWLLPYTPFGYPLAERFWSGIGAVLFVSAVSQLPLLVKLYSSAVAQYLGKISFSLYLVHFWCVQGYGVAIFYHTWSVFSQEQFFTGAVGFVLGYVALLGSTIWIADLFQRGLETPCSTVIVKLEKWLFTET